VTVLTLTLFADANPSNEPNPSNDSGSTTETSPAQENRESKPDGAGDLERRESEFTEMLSGAVLEGSWQVAHGEDLGGAAPLSEPRTDRYSIVAVRKGSDDQWIVGARVEYMEKDVTLPVPVRVIWAGDTPVITLDSMNLPGLGRYSARVMFHRGYYSGVWHGDNYGGVMSGRIIKSDGSKEEQGRKSGDKSDDE